MKRCLKFSAVGTLAACLLSAHVALAVEPAGKLEKETDQKQEAVAAKDLFAAIDAGLVDVRVIPKDATQITVIVENKTEQPITLHLPEVFAAVPIHAQFGGGMGGMGGGMGGGGMGGMGGGMGGGGMGGGQGMGGGMGGMGGGMGGMGGGMGGMGGGMGGMMRIAPEKSTKFKAACVCLEHGKPDPNPKMKYKLVPLDAFTSDVAVQELCSMVGRGQVSQPVAQAAAWHVMDGLTWEELATKNREESQFTGNIRFFTPEQVLNAVKLVATLSDSEESGDTSLESGRYNGGNRE